MKRFSITCLALAVLAVTPTLADVQKGTGEFGLDVSLFDFDSGLGQTGTRFAMRAGYFFTDVIGIEGMAAIASANGGDGLDPDLTTVHVDAVVNFPHTRNLVPYFLIGGGWAKLDAGSTDDDGPSWQVLGGARFYGSKGKFGIRLEGGGVWVDAFDETFFNYMLTLGFTWTIGGPHPHGKPPSPFTPQSY